MSRRLRFLLCVAAVGVLGTLRGAGDSFDFEILRYRAKMLAETPYAPPEPVPEWLLKLNYDQHRLIRFRAERSLWRRDGLPFQAQFFHAGFIFNQSVRSPPSPRGPNRV
jgi:periplasmic glucans biosynthesis protein